MRAGKVVGTVFEGQRRFTLAVRFPKHGWETLSMGMSGDYRIAIEEGATLLRIGSLVFGPRPKQEKP